MNTVKSGNDLGRIWERFVSGAEIDLSSLRPEIADSWRRCRDAKVSPYLIKSLQTNNKLSSFDEELVKVSGPVLSLINQAMTGRGKVVTLTNRESKILSTIGDTRGVDAAVRINGMAGCIWDERVVGTNAASIAILEGKPTEVKWHEHYAEDLHKDWACCSSPIFHPFDNEIIGSLVIGAVGKSAHLFPTELAIYAANIIRDLVGKFESEWRLVLSDAFEDFQRRYPDAAVLSVDAHGYVVQANTRATSILGTQTICAGQRLPEVVGLESGMTLVNTAGTPLPHEISLSIGDRAGKAMVHPVSHGGCIVLIMPPKSAGGTAPSKTTWKTAFSFDDVIGESKQLRHTIYAAQKAAQTEYPILLIGESGTGKELFAHAIHETSARRDAPFVALNCGTSSPDLVVAEMCGNEPGAFTGADRHTRKGVFDTAHSGTLFLDELQDMDPKAQSLLLRFLESGTYVRVGGSQPLKADVRIIAAANISLAEIERQQLVRPDLLYRLNCITIEIPALRERSEDIRPIGEYCLRQDLHFTGDVDEDVWSVLQRSEWRGNVRELRNVLLRAMLVCSDNHITLEHLPRDLLRQVQKPGLVVPSGSDSCEDISEILRETNGNVREAARRLGIHWTTLYRRLARGNMKQG